MTIIKGGAFSYIPKDEMVDIAIYLDDAIQAKLKDGRKSQNWFRKWNVGTWRFDVKGEIQAETPRELIPFFRFDIKP
jgi:hypothetical protein